MNVRPDPLDSTRFYVESESKRDTGEHVVDLAEGVCSCTDDSARLRARRREKAPFKAWPAPDRSVCKHTTAVLLFLGRHMARELRKQAVSVHNSK